MQMILNSTFPLTYDELTVRYKIEKCVSDIKSWMTVNKLKLNDEKT